MIRGIQILMAAGVRFRNLHKGGGGKRGTDPTTCEIFNTAIITVTFGFWIIWLAKYQLAMLWQIFLANFHQDLR